MNVKTRNKIKIIGNLAELTTSNGVCFIVDKIDLERVSQHTWCLGKTGYLVANINKKVVRLHRYLLDCKSNEIVDHIDGNPKNNSRANLRVCTPSQNGKNIKIKKNNTSGYPGISFLPHVNKYRVRITVDRKEIALGRYFTFEEALEARTKAEKKYYKQFAPCLGVLKTRCCKSKIKFFI